MTRSGQKLYDDATDQIHTVAPRLIETESTTCQTVVSGNDAGGHKVSGGPLVEHESGPTTTYTTSSLAA
jgi:hypothetical protein